MTGAGRGTVVGLVRHESELLVVRRPESAPFPGRWDGITADDDGDPATTAREAVRDVTGADPSVVRVGDRIAVRDAGDGLSDAPGTVTPVLLSAERRGTLPGAGLADWIAPPALRDRETVPWLLPAYEAVRPTPETVASDPEHGAATLSVRALDALRDEAVVAAASDDARGGADGATDWAALLDYARRLRDARPSMPVVGNRVARAMDRASDERTPAAVAAAASDSLDRARQADDEAAARAADRLGDRVVTLSRSGTVFAALVSAAPEAVVVAESRPGGEGVGTAERVADATDADVWLTTDAGVAPAVADRAVDTAVVGADAILADGSVVNKVGTRALATVAAREKVDCLAVAASDKVAPGTDADREERDPAELYDGDAAVSVANPTFDVTPLGLFDAVVTERGVLDGAAVRELAQAHRERRARLD